MPETTPAEELREAAKRLRERAQWATEGPWSVQEEHGRDIAGDGFSDVRVTGPAGVVAVTYLTGVIETGPHEDNAAYIASMHPGVATAVAGWLDIEAGILEKGLPDPTGGWAEARAVARAVLGTGERDAPKETTHA